jgi:hypothetical protein
MELNDPVLAQLSGDHSADRQAGAHKPEGCGMADVAEFLGPALSALDAIVLHVRIDSHIPKFDASGSIPVFQSIFSDLAEPQTPVTPITPLSRQDVVF